MQPKRFALQSTILILLLSPGALSAPGLAVLPAWQRNPHPRFEARDGALWADGVPMPIIYEFTWSAPRDSELYRYHAQFLGNGHWHPIRFDVLAQPGFSVDHVDDHYAQVAGARVFMTLCPGIQNVGSYAAKHPHARMLTSQGKPQRNTASFMHPGWRQAIAATMTRLGQHVADKPYHLGYYPQDEYAYRCFGGYEPASIEAFRKWVLARYKGLDELNRAWGAGFASESDIQPPRKFEKSVAFADWQEFRRWAQIDYTRVIYESLHKGDPNGMVIWSLPFWGSWYDCASWWDFAPYTDIFMRHGIGYGTGIYRIQMLRALSEWSGKPANALCMPPNYNPTYVQLGFMLDGPRSGLSHVCVGGSETHTYYMGAADSDNHWKRREPMYTKSRALNDLVRYLGPTYLLSKRKQPPVGVFLSDRTVLVNGTDLKSINGILNLLSDLNVEVEVLCEKNLADLGRFKAIFAGSYARCINEELSAQFRAFAHKGGLLVLARGAFAGDWYNRDVGEPGFGWADVVGASADDSVKSIHTVSANLPSAAPAALPVAGAIAPRKRSAAKVLAVSDTGQPVIVRNGNVIYFGVDPGIVYTAGYTDDFAGVKKITDKQILTEFAGFDFDHEVTGADLLKFGAHKAYAQFIRVLLKEVGIGPELTISGPGQAIAALRARALYHGRDILVAIANRVVRPGKDHKDTPARDYHRVHRDLQVSLPVEGHPKYAVRLPFAEVAGQRVDSLPDILPLRVQNGTAHMRLPELVDVAAVLLTSDHPPLLGIGLDRRVATAGEEIRVRGRIVNAAAQRAKGHVYLDACPPLRSTGRKPIPALESGAMTDFEDVLTIPAETKPGYYLVQWVGEFGEQPRTSTSLEIEVVEDVRFQIERARLTRFPIEDKGSTIEVSARSNLPAPLPVTVAVQVPAGYRAEPAEQVVRCSRGAPVTIRSTIAARTAAPPAVAEALVRVSATVRGQPYVQDRRIRLAHGAVTYREPKSVRYAAAQESRRDVELVVLENPQLKATFIEAIGVLHELVLRETGSDHLAEGDYPFGFTWYGGPGGWRLTELSPPGESVSATFTTHARGGAAITLKASLGREDEFVKLEYDTGAMAKAYGSFYLMSRVSRTGEHDVMYVPLKKGLRKMPWTKRGAITPTIADLAERWLAVHSTAKDEVLSVIYNVPQMESVLCRPRNNSHNYWVFHLNPGAPGKMTFWIAAHKGGLERVRELYRALPDRAKP